MVLNEIGEKCLTEKITDVRCAYINSKDAQCTKVGKFLFEIPDLDPGLVRLVPLDKRWRFGSYQRKQKREFVQGIMCPYHTNFVAILRS
jgi:hypothetical protein